MYNANVEQYYPADVMLRIKHDFALCISMTDFNERVNN